MTGGMRWMPLSQDVTGALPTFLLRKGRNATGEVEARVHPRATEVGIKQLEKKNQKKQNKEFDSLE